MREIAVLTSRVADAPDDDEVIQRLGSEVREMCGRFPLYGEWVRV
jgi:glycine/serine hydroxymethyltransferase